MNHLCRYTRVYCIVGMYALLRTFRTSKYGTKPPDWNKLHSLQDELNIPRLSVHDFFKNFFVITPFFLFLLYLDTYSSILRSKSFNVLFNFV